MKKNIKNIIKKILQLIVQKGYLNFIAGNLKLKFYKELEINRVPLIRDVLYTYYESIFIGASSVVTKNVEANSFYVGNPAKK